jgi:hypothetical protein
MTMARASIQQLDIAKEAALAEIARDRSRCYARIDEYRSLIAVLEEGLNADILMLQSVHTQEKARVVNRFESLKAHFLGEIDKEARALADLEGEPVAGSEHSQGTGDGTDDKSMIGHNIRKLTP